MKKRKLKWLTCSVVLDFMGCGALTAEDEFKELWIEEVVENVLQEAPQLLYVGLAKNIVRDLEGLFGKYILHFEAFKAGMDGEFVVSISEPKTLLWQ